MSNGSIMQHLHNLAPNAFPLTTERADDTRRSGMNEILNDTITQAVAAVNPFATQGKSPVLDAVEYIRKASTDMLLCHDRRIPLVLREFYRTLLRSNDKTACTNLSYVFDLYIRSLSRLNFCKDAVQFGTGVMASTMSPALAPLDRGVRSVDITPDDVFNDMRWYRDKWIDESGLTYENPYVRLGRSMLLEALREYMGNDSRLFKDNPVYDDADEKLVREYIATYIDGDARRVAAESATEKSATTGVESNNIENEEEVSNESRRSNREDFVTNNRSSTSPATTSDASICSPTLPDTAPRATSPSGESSDRRPTSAEARDAIGDLERLFDMEETTDDHHRGAFSEANSPDDLETNRDTFITSLDKKARSAIASPVYENVPTNNCSIDVEEDDCCSFVRKKRNCGVVKARKKKDQRRVKRRRDDFNDEYNLRRDVEPTTEENVEYEEALVARPFDSLFVPVDRFQRSDYVLEEDDREEGDSDDGARRWSER